MLCTKNCIIFQSMQGRIKDFQKRGEGEQEMYITSVRRKVPYGWPGNSRVLDALKCFLSIILRHSIYAKRDTEQKYSPKHGWSKFRGGAHLLRPRLLHPRLDPPLVHIEYCSKYEKNIIVCLHTLCELTITLKTEMCIKQRVINANQKQIF